MVGCEMFPEDPFTESFVTIANACEHLKSLLDDLDQVSDTARYDDLEAMADELYVMEDDHRFHERWGVRFEDVLEAHSLPLD